MYLPLHSFAVALAALAAIVNGAPIASADASPNYVAPTQLFKRVYINDCGDADFVNRSSGGSPKISDCEQIAINIDGGGSWNVGVGFQHQLVQYGTCAFGVKGDAGREATFNIGNKDIIDLIRDSIAKFAWNGLVGAEGTMDCEGQSFYDVTVYWGIYHT